MTDYLIALCEHGGCVNILPESWVDEPGDTKNESGGGETAILQKARCFGSCDYDWTQNIGYRGQTLGVGHCSGRVLAEFLGETDNRRYEAIIFARVWHTT